MTIQSLLLAGAATAAVAGGSMQVVKPAGPDLMEALSACHRVTDEASRLLCYDHASSTLMRAEEAGDVVVVDRERIRAVKREAFGFHMPSLSLFPHGADHPLAVITVALASTSRNADGKWVLSTQDGAQWLQTDSEDVDVSSKESLLTVRSGALGSYFCKVGRQAAVRCMRQR